MAVEPTGSFQRLAEEETKISRINAKNSKCFKQATCVKNFCADYDLMSQFD